MVYSDGIHLIADTIWELHNFARDIGLKRSWFQDKQIPHYDLTTRRKAKKAILTGAKEISSREIVMRAKLCKPEKGGEYEILLPPLHFAPGKPLVLLSTGELRRTNDEG